MHLDILAFGAHPDDVELFAGGTLAKMGALGYRTGIVDMTRGELGSRGTAELRAEEAAQAARILKVQVRENLGFPDGDVPVNADGRLRTIEILRKYRPSVVLVHHWDDKHPDHVNTSRLVAEAAHHSGLSKIETGQQRHRPKVLLYYKLPPPANPTFVVDVSSYVDQRNGAIRCYRSQLFDASSSEPSTYLSQPEFLNYVENIHAYYGTLIGTKIGEGFFMKGVPEIHDLVSFFDKERNLRFR